ESPKHSFRYLVSEFVEHIKKTDKAPEEPERHLTRYVLPRWLSRDARSIKPDEAKALCKEIADRGVRGRPAPTMANRVAETLHRAFKFGIEQDICEANPVNLKSMPAPATKPRERWLNDAELTALTANAHAITGRPRLAHVLMLCLLTGKRIGEIAGASWKEIDLAKKAWSIPGARTKN